MDYFLLGFQGLWLVNYRLSHCAFRRIAAEQIGGHERGIMRGEKKPLIAEHRIKQETNRERDHHREETAVMGFVSDQ